jgi:hypothetical protein
MKVFGLKTKIKYDLNHKHQKTSKLRAKYDLAQAQISQNMIWLGGQ